MLVDLTAAWKQLALQLCIPIYKQEEIAKPSTVGDCLGKILEVWVTGTGTATLEVLIRALESHAVGNPALAQELMNDIDIFKQLVPASDEGELPTLQTTS